jgi:hypothetical protein
LQAGVGGWATNAPTTWALADSVVTSVVGRAQIAVAARGAVREGHVGALTRLRIRDDRVARLREEQATGLWSCSERNSEAPRCTGDDGLGEGGLVGLDDALAAEEFENDG